MQKFFYSKYQQKAFDLNAVIQVGWKWERENYSDPYEVKNLSPWLWVFQSVPSLSLRLPENEARECLAKLGLDINPPPRPSL